MTDIRILDCWIFVDSHTPNSNVNVLGSARIALRGRIFRPSDRSSRNKCDPVVCLEEMGAAGVI